MWLVGHTDESHCLAVRKTKYVAQLHYSTAVQQLACTALEEQRLFAATDVILHRTCVTCPPLQVGGLDQYLSALKEMVFLPLLYPEIFDKFGVSPPRGVLFHGPPGTGKTLVARALAAQASRAAGQKVRGH
jgi:ATP-dependent 26S proteasome regulatory subunit